MNELHARIKNHLPQLHDLKKNFDSHWGVEDLVYRFYHQSYKAYRSQNLILSFLKLLEEICKDDYELDDWFLKIVHDGTGKKFVLEHNNEWLTYVRPQIEALMHCHYFLNQMVKYSTQYETVPTIIDSGYAAIMCLFKVR